MNVYIGLILILAVIADIWLRQEHILSGMLAALRRRSPEREVR